MQANRKVETQLDEKGAERCKHMLLFVNRGVSPFGAEYASAYLMYCGMSCNAQGANGIGASKLLLAGASLHALFDDRE